MQRKLIFFTVTFLIIVLLIGFSKADDLAIKALIENAGDASKYPGSDVVVVFDSTDVNVKDSGLSYVHMHVLTKVLAPKGAISLKALTRDYDPQSAYVEYKSARIFRHTGEIDTLPLDRVLDHAAPARWIYWGMREKVLPVGRLEVGDALEVVIFRKGFTYALLADSEEWQCPAGALNQNQDISDEQRYIPPMRGHFYDIVPFWSSDPILVKSYTVTLPADKPLQYEFYNGEAGSWIHFHGDKAVYNWTKKDIKPFKSEPNMVAHSDVAPKLLVSTSPDWQAKSLWFHKVNEDYGSFDVTPEVKAKVDELVKDCKSDMEKIEILTHWVAEEIRYSGLSMGEGEGYTLHKGEMTFRDRCGVCKDKAGMLVTMLRAAGFESYPAMTMAGSRIDRIPADQFNHSVTLWKKSDGNYMLLDPTWVPGVRELWSSAEQQQQYLMGVPEGADLKTTPLSPPEKHYFRVRGESELQADGTLVGEFSVEAEGQSDAILRRNLTRRFKSLWGTYFEQALCDISPRAKLLELRYNDPYDISQPMKVFIKYQIPKYAIVSEEQILFTPVVARHVFSGRGTNAYLHTNLELEERKHGFRTRCSKLIDFEETVRLPKGYKVTFTPEFEPVDGEAASFEASYEADKKRLNLSEKLALKKRLYEAEDYENFIEAVRSVKKMTEEKVVLSR